MDAFFQLMQKKKKKKQEENPLSNATMAPILERNRGGFFGFFLKWRLDEEADTEQDAVIFPSDLTGDRMEWVFRMVVVQSRSRFGLFFFQ